MQFTVSDDWDWECDKLISENILQNTFQCVNFDILSFYCWMISKSQAVFVGVYVCVVSIVWPASWPWSVLLSQRVRDFCLQCCRLLSQWSVLLLAVKLLWPCALHLLSARILYRHHANIVMMLEYIFAPGTFGEGGWTLTSPWWIPRIIWCLIPSNVFIILHETTLLLKDKCSRFWTVTVVSS